MDDLISRQDAIDEVVAWLKDRMSDKKNGKPLTERLKDLPSAQPEIIRCKDCKYCEKVDHDLMCCNVNSWVIATHDDFGCVLAERRTNE